jgi:hypothetical protein
MPSGTHGFSVVGAGGGDRAAKSLADSAMLLSYAALLSVSTGQLCPKPPAGGLRGCVTYARAHSQKGPV